MECTHCGGWVHAKGEGIDGEQYQVLSYLPDSVEYVCKIVTKNDVPVWMEAIHSEIKNGQRKIIGSIFTHNNSNYFQHDYKRAKAKSSVPSSDKQEELSEIKSNPSDSIGAGIVKRNLFEIKYDTQSIDEIL